MTTPEDFRALATDSPIDKLVKEIAALVYGDPLFPSETKALRDIGQRFHADLLQKTQQLEAELDKARNCTTYWSDRATFSEAKLNPGGVVMTQLADKDAEIARLKAAAQNQHETTIEALRHDGGLVTKYRSEAEAARKQVGELRAALEYEERIAKKEFELLKLRVDEGQEQVRPFGSNAWYRHKRLTKALAASPAGEKAEGV